MPELLLAVAATCLGSLALGQGVLALCGAREWSWLAAPVGLSTMILVAVPAIHVPGRAITVSACLAVLLAAGLLLWLRRPPQRPPLGALLAALPVALLVLVPFAAAGRVGTLGMSFNNDMGEHLLLAEAYRSSAVAAVAPLLPDYPLGPHALAAALAEGLGVRIDLAFAGLSAAIPILTAWTAQACVARARWPWRVLVAITVGIPYLIAAYYGQGAFKELMEALFALASVLILAGYGGVGVGWRRWIPLAFVLGGAVSVYSLQGLAWPVSFLAVWIAGRALQRGWRSGLRAAWRELSAELIPGAIGALVLVLLLVPQIPRVVKFVEGVNSSIPKNNLGNLVGPLSGWQAFGAWNNHDFRFPATPAFTAGMWTAFVLALVVVGGLVMLRGRRWMLPAAALTSLVIWRYADQTQSPYAAAKALVILSPLLLLLASLGVIEVTQVMRRRRTSFRIVAPLLAAVLLFRVVDSSWEALRFSKVAPTEHLVELRSLRPLLGAQPTLYLGNDDFINWELAGSRVTPAYLAGVAETALRPEKRFTYGQALDFDSVTSATLNAFDWVITQRDAAGSQAPPQMQLARLTRSYALWRRVGTVTPHKTLVEGPGAAAPLNCASPEGRAILRSGGVAATRAPEQVAAVPLISPGASVTASLALTPGTWDLETPYFSPLPVKVVVGGLRTTLPANLERPGPRWPIGQITVARAGAVTVTMQTAKYWLTPASDIAEPVAVLATPAAADQIVPVRAACGKLVDWYESA
jgi:hypothetical protein